MWSTGNKLRKPQSQFLLLRLKINLDSAWKRGFPGDWFRRPCVLYCLKGKQERYAVIMCKIHIRQVSSLTFILLKPKMKWFYPLFSTYPSFNLSSLYPFILPFIYPLFIHLSLHLLILSLSIYPLYPFIVSIHSSFHLFILSLSIYPLKPKNKMDFFPTVACGVEHFVTINKSGIFIISSGLHK